MLDRTQTAEPVRYNLLKGVSSITVRFMTPAREWVDRWPVLDGQNPLEQERTRPAAVEVTLELDDWGVIRRLVEVAN